MTLCPTCGREAAWLKPTPTVWPHSTPESAQRPEPRDQTTPGRVTMTFTTMTKGDA